MGIQEVVTAVTLLLALIASGGAWRSAGRIEKSIEATEARLRKHSDTIGEHVVTLARLETVPDTLRAVEARRREDFAALTSRLDELHSILSGRDRR